MSALADAVIEKARRSTAATASKAEQTSIACYWRVEIMLHGGQTITRDVATAPNGDTFAIAYDAIATISVRKLQGVPPSGIVGSLQ